LFFIMTKKKKHSMPEMSILGDETAGPQVARFVGENDDPHLVSCVRFHRPSARFAGGAK